MWWNTHYTNGEAISHQFIMLLDPPKWENGKSWAKVGTGEPPPLAWKLSQLWPNFSRFPVWGGPITLWIDEILPPHLCSVCFITFMDSCKANLVLGNFAKKLGFGQTPPPWLVQKTNFSHFFLMKAPLICFDRWGCPGGSRCSRYVLAACHCNKAGTCYLVPGVHLCWQKKFHSVVKTEWEPQVAEDGDSTFQVRCHCTQI